jgi:hypothetical protein
MITNYASCACAIESRIIIAKAEFNKKNFHQQIGKEKNKKSATSFCMVLKLGHFGK